MEKYTSTKVNDIYLIPPTYRTNHNIVNKLITKFNKIIKYSTFDTAYTDNDVFNGIIDNVKIMDEKIITITYWPPCYGHLLESLFNLYSFYINKPYNGYKILLGIPPNSKNMIDLANYLFKDIFIKSYDLPQIVEFKEVVLIHNHTNYDCFFKFDNDHVKEHIRTYYNSNNIQHYDNVFLTRSINGYHDMKSVLSNLDYITNFFIS